MTNESVAIIGQLLGDSDEFEIGPKKRRRALFFGKDYNMIYISVGNMPNLDPKPYSI